MFIPATIQKIPLLKIQRPVFSRAKQPQLLIYSTDGKIMPTMVPDSGCFKDALGDKASGYFVYTIENGEIHLGSEVYHKD